MVGLLLKFLGQSFGLSRLFSKNCAISTEISPRP